MLCRLFRLFKVSFFPHRFLKGLFFKISFMSDFFGLSRTFNFDLKLMLLAFYVKFYVNFFILFILNHITQFIYSLYSFLPREIPAGRKAYFTGRAYFTG